MRPITVLFLTAMHKRYAVSELYCIGLKRLFDAAPSYVKPIAAAVVTDEASGAICKKYGIDYLIAPNEPLGRKWNMGLRAQLDKPWDYLIINGDDDLLASDLCKIYDSMFKARHDYFGIKNEYFYHPASNQALYFEYDNKQNAPNKIIGGARVISRKAIESTVWYYKVVFRGDFEHAGMTYKHGDTALLNIDFAIYLSQMGRAVLLHQNFFMFWKDYQTKGLDNESEIALISHGFFPYAVVTTPPILIDVKTEQNVWSFDKLQTEGRPVPVSEALYFLSAHELDYINEFLK